MRRKDKLVTDIEVLRSVIRKAQVCRIAMVDGDTPYLVPMNFGFDGTDLYFHAAKQGRKLDILRKNPNICVEFEQNVELVPGKKPCDYGFHYLTVICYGQAEFLDVLEEKRWALHQIITQYHPDWQRYNFNAGEVASIVLFKVKITDIVGKVSGVDAEDENVLEFEEMERMIEEQREALEETEKALEEKDRLIEELRKRLQSDE